MKKLNESLAEYQWNIANALSKMLEISTEQSDKILSNIDADTYINLTAAIDKGDVETVRKLVGSQITPETEKPSLDGLKQLLQSLARNKKLDWDAKFQKAFNIIKKMSIKDWRLVWPGLDETFIKQLYQKVAKKSVDTISQNEAKLIWNWVKENIMEQAIFENQIVNIVIPHGPKNTVGIVIEGKTVMVSKNKLKQINEHVLGMTQMPTITRMRELAGMTTSDVIDEVQHEKYEPAYKAIIEVDYDNPLENSRVAILGGAGSYTMKGLQSKIAREQKELANELADDDANYRASAYRAKQLTNSLNTMVAALEDLAKIRVKENLQDKIPDWVADWRLGS